MPVSQNTVSLGFMPLKVHFTERTLVRSLVESQGVTNPSRWSTREVFKDCLKQFITIIRCFLEKLCLLIMANSEI